MEVEKIIEATVNFLRGVSPEWVIAIIAALPIVELRLSIPYGIWKMGMNVWVVLIMSIIGNTIPVLPLLYLLEPVSRLLRRFKLWKKFFDWLFERTRKKSKIIEQYELWGLMIFVAIPLPMTGAWTGCVAASLFGLNKKLSFFAITAGIIIASIIVFILTLGTKGCFEYVR